MPTKLSAHIIPLLVLLTLSFSAWGVYNYVFFKQVVLYKSELEASSATTPAVVVGPGFWVFSAYVVCTLLMTPVTAFWTLVAALVIITCVIIFLWICWICFKCALVCLAAMGTRTQTQTTTYVDTSSGFQF